MKTNALLSYSIYSVLLSLAACGGGGGGGSSNAASGGGAAAAASGNGSVTASGTSAPASGDPASGTAGTTGNAGVVAGATPAVVSPSVVSNAALVMTCAAPVTSVASSGGGLIAVDTPSADGTRMFASGSTFQLAIAANPPGADTLAWTVNDALGKTVASGNFAAPSGGSTTTLNCTSTLAGYFAVSATLAKAGGSVPTAGTRPTGFATFGVLPDVTPSLPAPTYAHQEQHRFGMQGFNGWTAMLGALGISSTIDDRQLSSTEPNGPNSFAAAATTTDTGYSSGQIMRLVRLDGIPAWASPTGAFNDSAYLPKDQAGYQSYLNQVGSETEAMRRKYFPAMTSNYYQVTWEPDQTWLGSSADFVTLYKLAYTGLHATDPNAVVMGPTGAFPSLTTNRLKAMAPLGLAQYLDGIATHGYYDAGTSPSHPPERLATDPDPANAANALMNEMRNLRQEMQADYRPGIKLFATETGISYDLGTSYGPDYPTSNVLFAQGAIVARTHIILLGEGADQTYVFYGADYPGETGYGTFFDLSNAQGSFGASNVSPKPAALAVAAMTRVLDGTITLGPVSGTPSGVYAYAFEQRGTGNAVTALWTHNNAVWSASGGFSQTYSVGYTLAVDAPGTSGTVQVLDWMGNASSVAYGNGVVSLNLTEAPLYVVSKNAGVAKANATLPVGYTGA
ncbi:serine/threonine protein kinase [Caballeronia sordidicola]|uniref:Serine/threonine protein kinase n=2 Tax=Caballeronia sordidicola TaxID=196367 RepID=A0A242N0H7_CABSO|nr:serine/threonine protein kinase [Caballeronia sordidicola]